MAEPRVVESFHTIEACEDYLGGVRQVSHVFMLPRWVRAWTKAFAPDDKLDILVMKRNEEVVGVAPLFINGTTASFVGDSEVFDYMDFAVAPGHEKEFYSALLAELSNRRVTTLDLRCLRPESTVFSHLIATVRNRNGRCSFEPDGVSVEIDLPSDWNEYLNMLHPKQRHEVRRKLKRLREAADVHFLVFDNPAEISGHLDMFLKMFRESRPDKAVFMDSRMEFFFRSMTRAMSEEGILRLFALKLDNSIAAASVCFDYRDTMYLYNSGYDPRYKSLSVGLLCKVLSIRHSIEAGRKKYDFLKGAEPYKHRLGGKEVRLSRCRVVMKPQ